MSAAFNKVALVLFHREPAAAVGTAAIQGCPAEYARAELPQSQVQQIFPSSRLEVPLVCKNAQKFSTSNFQGRMLWSHLPYADFLMWQCFLPLSAPRFPPSCGQTCRVCSAPCLHWIVQFCQSLGSFLGYCECYLVFMGLSLGSSSYATIPPRSPNFCLLIGEFTLFAFKETSNNEDIISAILNLFSLSYSSFVPHFLPYWIFFMLSWFFCSDIF